MLLDLGELGTECIFAPKIMSPEPGELRLRSLVKVSSFAAVVWEHRGVFCRILRLYCAVDKGLLHVPHSSS